MKTISIASVAILSSASSPEAAISTSNPWSFSSLPMAKRAALESSTSSTFIVFSICGYFRKCACQYYSKPSSQPSPAC
ncbi:hypothetical protein [Thiolapillus sp.]|uniref:hypothetical protein n=1 Tax=Thiolapillus sp. TaxID=2017437 RepID=UPI003AF82E38